jgi:SAM-dependent methyltransferase
MLDVHLLIEKVVLALRKDGLMATCSKAVTSLRPNRLADDFDLKYGTDTGVMVPLWKLQISSQNRRFGTRYQATDWQELADVIAFLNEDVRTFTFIDLGCGKGRTLIGASALGFRHVIGVEFACELVEIARANLAKAGAVNASVEHADAADFQVPNGDTILYLYNPFTQDVMRQVVAKLRESHSGKLYVIYKVPECAEVLDLSGFLTRFGHPPDRPSIAIWKATDRNS